MVKKKSTINPVMTGAAGAVIGAGIGAAAGAAMTNPKTRKKVEKVVENVQKQATNYVKSMNKTGMEEGRKAVSNIAAKAGISEGAMKNVTKTSKTVKKVGGKAKKNK